MLICYGSKTLKLKWPIWDHQLQLMYPVMKFKKKKISPNPVAGEFSLKVNVFKKF